MQRICKENIKNIKAHGGKTRLTQETELLIVEIISSLTSWRVPLDSLVNLVKGYTLANAI